MTRKVTQAEIEQMKRRIKIDRIIEECSQPGWKNWEDYTLQEQRRIILRYDDRKPQIEVPRIESDPLYCKNCGDPVHTAWMVLNGRVYCIDCYLEDEQRC